MSEPAHSNSSNATHDVLKAARSWLDKDGRVALATVVGTWGSAPVGVGGQMVVAADGRFEGSVSGGCVEGEVIAEAEDILADGKPKTLTFGVADETAWQVGLPCGGPDQGVHRASRRRRTASPARPRAWTRAPTVAACSCGRA